ncbi:MAG: ATP-binding protein [Bryobacteraceae bacterium]
MKISDLFSGHEGKTLEFKRDLSSPERVLATIVAFANTAGGTLVIGLQDATKDAVGVSDVLAAELQLANMISDSIQPMVIPSIEVMPWRETQLLDDSRFGKQHEASLSQTAGAGEGNLRTSRIEQSQR